MIFGMRASAQNLGAPCLDFQTWETMNLNRGCPTHNLQDLCIPTKPGAPSFPRFLREGWETTQSPSHGTSE